MATRMQQRRGTAAQWLSTNSGNGPILNAGEIGWESDTNRFKIGDGVNTWLTLDYFADVDSTINPAFGSSITFEGTTANAYETTLQVTDPTADRTITLPNVTGTVITTGNLSDITDIGVFTSTIVMEGITADAAELTLSAGNPTVDRTITFPDETGTVALEASVASSLSTALGSYILTTKIGASTDGVAGLNADSNLLVPGTKIIFEGTVNDFETEFVVTNPSADVTLSFPNATDTVVGRLSTDTLTNKTLTSPKINEDVVMSSTATELNILDGATLSTTELNYVDGVTSAIQTQIDTKAPLASPTFTGTVNAAAITTSGDVVVGDQAFVGTGASTFSGAGDGNLTNPAMVVRFANGASESSFAQMAFQNNDSTSSSDMIVYADNGNDTAGWTDIGMTGSTFADAEFTITGANDGYMFVEAPIGNLKSINNKALTGNVATLTTSAAHGYAIADEVVITGVDATFNGTYTIASVPTDVTFTYAKTATNVSSAAVSPVGIAKVATGNGNLVLATGGNGTRNKIVFAAGGLSSDNTQMEITPDQNVHIEIATPSTSSTTGALTVVGGVGIQGDMNIQGDVAIEGTITFGGAGTTVETANLSVTDPLVFVGADNAADISDLGLIGEYTTSGNTKYFGIARDASDGVVKAFKDATTKPTSTVNFSEAGLAYADLQVGGITATSASIGDVSNTELQYLNGVTSAVQTQLDAKLTSATAASTYAPIANPVFTGTVSVPTSIEFEGATANEFETTLTITDPTVDRTITLPDATGTVSLLTNTETLTNKTLTAPVVNLGINAQTGTTYTFVLADNGKFVTASNASSQTYTIPPAASVAYDVGAQINLVRKGAGAVAFAQGAGVTIRSTGATSTAPTLRAQYSTATCIYEGSDIWYVVGDIS